MTEPKNPRKMGLGEIVRELNLLTSVKILFMITDGKRAYTIAPSYCKNPGDLSLREDQLYSELSNRDEIYRGQKTI